jgi:hypothetical protein
MCTRPCIKDVYTVPLRKFGRSAGRHEMHAASCRTRPRSGPGVSTCNTSQIADTFNVGVHPTARVQWSTVHPRQRRVANAIGCERVDWPYLTRAVRARLRSHVKLLVNDNVSEACGTNRPCVVFTSLCRFAEKRPLCSMHASAAHMYSFAFEWIDQSWSHEARG